MNILFILETGYTPSSNIPHIQLVEAQAPDRAFLPAAPTPKNSPNPPLQTHIPFPGLCPLPIL